MTDLFTPLPTPLGELPHRIVLAPLTRNRADENGVPTDLQVEYYRQRASAALIITEGTQPSAVGQGYLNTPGIHSAEQVAGWRRVADAVHGEGGRIVVQLMHAGRVAHPDNKHGLETVAPSALAAPGEMFTANGPKPHPVPRALSEDEIPSVVQEYVDAARNAIDAGLDGVEVHGANGYLIHQFLAPGSNQRTDGYGGSPAARARFGIEVVRAVVDAIGADRVGLRLSPAHNIQGATEEDEADTRATYTAFLEGIADLGIAYVSVLADPRGELAATIRSLHQGVLLINDGFTSVTTREGAEKLLAEGLGDAVVVGRLFLANPDLPRRWHERAELNEPNPDTFYGGGAEGYIDYPTLDEMRESA
ncbi:alkene reductase [Nostocoides sp. Soil756]|jgi:2,4-dienoyl-CoA reductase-like NADH-dependent reductase (Old Yellow Enzyme family)|uniref:alkene reductase n=1 Tax=Nostocoides sp. Soil756 TaxID=1736399 RepID=UPI0006FB3629|nr:alkene reductase [Tetrasphaera sp. Soil756]KRE63735.1 1,2-oxophytodienoate reductase [Tetrasphaera sp. Soil756]